MSDRQTDRQTDSVFNSVNNTDCAQHVVRGLYCQVEDVAFPGKNVDVTVYLLH